jgi:NDP-sugar pyrophosphorylase family protein
MSYRVVIPTAGTGSRLEGLTKYINKSLVSIANRPTISHLIEQFPQDCEFVIALGYKGNLVRDFLELAYPDRTFFFVDVDLYEGEGSGLGLSLLSCEQYLQQPFVFLSCDTLVKELIPEPDHNWMGYAKKDDLSQYRTLNVISENVTEICEKGMLKDNLKAYIGLAGVYNYQQFWQAMHSGKDISVSQGESYGMKAVLESNKVSACEFTWFDTGNLKSIQVVREVYSQPNEPNILEKENEAIWFVGDSVIKYSDEVDFIANRVKRAKELQEFVPNIYANKVNMYCYKRVDGEVLSEIINLPIFENFLAKCKDFWLEKDLSLEGQLKFQDNCLKFYKNKTLERVQLFYKNFDKKDNAGVINSEETSSLKDLLNQVDWEWISKGLAGRFHGDFHFENILYSRSDKKFIFLDWRQDFAGNLSVGDIYYDLAKLMHGLIVNHGLIADDQYSASWKSDKIKFDLHRKQSLVECEQRLSNWIHENGFELKKVKVLTALIYLNIAALHHYPYSILLYGLGKKMLAKELKQL